MHLHNVLNFSILLKYIANYSIIFVHFQEAKKTMQRNYKCLGVGIKIALKMGDEKKQSLQKGYAGFTSTDLYSLHGMEAWLKNGI